MGGWCGGEMAGRVADEQGREHEPAVRAHEVLRSLKQVLHLSRCHETPLRYHGNEQTSSRLLFLPNGKQRRSDHEDGEISDGASSTASYKVARGFSAMGFGRDDNDIR